MKLSLIDMNVETLSQEEMIDIEGGWVPMLVAGIMLGLYIGHHLWEE